jgi:prepilin-type N-terminal cleavage/methylation domain-containing protein
MAEIDNNMRSRRGFTLVEILAALLLLSVGVTGVMGVLASGIKTEQAGELIRDASRLALAVRDQLAHDGRLGAAHEPVPKGVSDGIHPDYPFLTYDLAFEADPELGSQVLVTITVKWLERGEAMDDEYRFFMSREHTLARRIQTARDKDARKYEGK